jgi:hypothetical protein
MFENEELKDAGGRLLAGVSKALSLRPGEYIKTKSLILEKSIFCGICESIDWAR